MASVDHLPDDSESLKRLLLAREEELVSARAQVCTAERALRGIALGRKA